MLIQTISITKKTHLVRPGPPLQEADLQTLASMAVEASEYYRIDADGAPDPAPLAPLLAQLVIRRYVFGPGFPFREVLCIPHWTKVITSTWSTTRFDVLAKLASGDLAFFSVKTIVNSRVINKLCNVFAAGQAISWPDFWNGLSVQTYPNLKNFLDPSVAKDELAGALSPMLLMSDAHSKLWLPSLNPDPNLPDDIPPSLVEAMIEANQSALDEFRRDLDVEAMQLAQPGMDWDTAVRYNYYRSDDPVIRRNRRQAALSYPALAGVLPLWRDPHMVAYARPDDVDSGGRAVADAVDKELPLAPKIVAALNIRPAAASGFQIAEPNHVLDLEDVMHRARMFDALPKAHWPRDELEMESAQFLCKNFPARSSGRVLYEFDRPPADARGVDFSLEASWWAELGRRAAKTSWADTRQWAVEGRFQTIDDFLLGALYAGFGRNFGQNISVAERHAFLHSLFSRSTFAQLMRWSREWHRFLQQLQIRAAHDGALAAAAPCAPRRVWPALVRAERTIGERRIVPLLDAADLLEEGQSLSHCVGGYGGYAARGDLFLFSLRDQDGQRKSTLSLKVTVKAPLKDAEHDEPILQMNHDQHFGPENSPPSVACRMSAHKFFQALLKGDRDVDAGFLARRIRRCQTVRSSQTVDELKMRAMGAEAALRIRRFAALIPALRNEIGIPITR